MTEVQTEMPAIRSLSPEVIDQIAAGEVVERPSHLVKELFENALDAGATEVEVEVYQDCTAFRVTDNGCGIPSEELSKALDRHATSKIRQTDDLWALQTYGFRGEALASIAAVSELSLQSRPPGEKIGWKVRSAFGQREDLAEVGSSVGTTISVERLFENVPARRKFMKSASAETAQVRQVVKALALAHPEVGVKFVVSDKLDLFYPKAKSLRERASAVLEVKELFSHTLDAGGNRCEVVFAHPRDAQKTSRNMWFLCQGRWIQDKTIAAACMEGFRGSLMHGEYPTVVVNLQVDPARVDVNIHPTKSQVKFIDSSEIFRLVARSLKEGLDHAPWNRLGVESAVLQYAQRSAEVSHQETHKPQFLATPRSEDSTKSAPAEVHPEWERVSFKRKDPGVPERVMPGTATPLVQDSLQTFEAAVTTEAYWSQFEVLGQAHLTYLVCQTREGVVLVDQHAAHERILFERLMRKWKSGQGDVQSYLFPLTVDLSAEKVEALERLSPSLQQLGVVLERLGPACIGVTAAPSYLKDSHVAGALEKLATEVLEVGESFVFEDHLSEFCASMACHSAIRAGQALSQEEMRALLKMMDESPRSSFCPHGRPVSVSYSLGEIERDFGRTV